MSQTKQGYVPKNGKHDIGYLPDEKPTAVRLFLYALQQVIVMFPATVTVALITGFHVSTTIFASGLATVCFVFITGGKIPMYYGSSFAYLTAIASLVVAEGGTMGAPGTFILPTELISKAQFGIVLSGFVSIFAGILVRIGGMERVEKILPPCVTGSVAMVIGLTLAGNAVRDAAPMMDAAGNLFEGQTHWIWIISLTTLISTVLYTKYLKGVLGQLPLLLGAITGCLVAVVVMLLGGGNFFRTMPEGALAASTWKLGDGSIFALPAFSLPKPNMMSVISIMPIAIATIPESTAHIYQLDTYVNELAKRKDKPRYKIAEMLDKNLIGDGICDMISGVIGGPAGTNYGENISTMAITKVFSVSVMLVAGILAMVISCFTPLINSIYAIPQAVIGGLEIYLFGAIAAQGIAIFIDKKVSMFEPKNIAVIATIMTLGLGINYGFGGNINFLGIKIPAVAGSAIFGILLNALLNLGDKKENSVKA